MPFTPKAKPWVIQNLLSFDSMVICWKAVEQYFDVELFVVQFSSVCNFGNFVTVRKRLINLLTNIH